MASSILSQGQDLAQAAGNALSYFAGQCTRFVAETLSWVPAGLGNANQWLGRARAMGLPTGSTPAVGAVATFPNLSPFGHVAVVKALIPGGIQVAEENYLGSGVTDVRNITGPDLASIGGYIYPPGGAGAGPGLGNLVGAATDPFGIGQAITGLPAQIGHGLADALAASVHDIGVFAKNQAPALMVALVVAVVLFAVPRD